MDNESKKETSPADMEIFYDKRLVKISDLTDEEKIDCISKLWTYKENIENEKETLQEMVQKMYFYGKMENIQDEKAD
jgi:hypothetical protein